MTELIDDDLPERVAFALRCAQNGFRAYMFPIEYLIDDE